MTEERDLWGKPIPEPGPRPQAPARGSGRGRRAATGHAAPAGSGPEGKTCGDCAHYTRVEYHNKTYRKCGKVRAHWTHGPGTDIRRKDPACRYFEPRP